MKEFLTTGYEDLELSTQILIKEALARGVAARSVGGTIAPPVAPHDN